jgi:3-isopropylmalate dehydrogenase
LSYSLKNRQAGPQRSKPLGPLHAARELSDKRLATVVMLPGDGIGTEVAAPATALLEQLGVAVEERAIGGAALDAYGSSLPEETLAACRRADAVLLGAVGGPQWPKGEAERGLFRLRKELDVYANLRPIRPHPALASQSPVRPEVRAGADFLIVRELTGGLYFGSRGRRDGRAWDTCEYTEREVERIARRGFELARRKVTSVDKANVLETPRLWREVVDAVSTEYPRIELEHLLVDSTAMRLVAAPADFDVLLTENTFGDILSDEAGMLVGSLGLLPSASLGDEGPALYEPVHGTAPTIAGLGIANPLAMLLSVAMLLRYSFDRSADAANVEAAVDEVISAGVVTPDLGGGATTQDVADGVFARL